MLKPTFWLLIAAGLGLATVGQAQTLPADCLLKTLGRSAGDTLVQQTFAALGLTLPTLPEGRQNVQQGVHIALDGKGRIESIIFFNDSIPYGGQLYRGYQGPLPFGFTFNDSLGIEENTLFNLPVAKSDQAGAGLDGIYREVVGVRVESGELAYRMQIQFTPARDYFEMKRTARNMNLSLPRLRRTYWYRFQAQSYPTRGEYLALPLSCDGGGVGFEQKARYSRTDSLFSFNLEGNIHALGRSFLKEDLGTGVSMGIVVRAPFGRRFAPPLRHQFGFVFGNHTYKAFSGQDNAPGISMNSLFYGLYAQPRLSLWTTPAGQLHPYVDARLYGDLFTSGRVLNAAGKTLKPASVSWGTQAGAGIMFEMKTLLFGAGVHYRYSRRVKYLDLRLDTGAVYDALPARSPFHAVVVQAWLGVRIIGS